MTRSRRHALFLKGDEVVATGTGGGGQDGGALLRRPSSAAGLRPMAASAGTGRAPSHGDGGVDWHMEGRAREGS